ncbi:MAG: indole-3-glycerol-phosphate synthase TrpC, partial [Flavobacterium sp.]|nr:indole-3-glycerol-phosphate synthase TrpC [Flavobacterium sp.]
MTILDTIKAQKLKEVAALKLNFNVSDLEKFPLFNSTTNSLKNAVKNALSEGVIAEFKRKSPAKGNINLEANVAEVTQGYVDAGVAGLSVLTDELFFGAKKDDFQLARKNKIIPILRKDFIVD